jgi:hypothetical protein
VTAASPLRGPKSIEGGGFAAAHLRARRAGYGAAPPASRTLRVSCGNGLRPPLTPETSAAPGAGRAGRRRACPGQARGAQGRSGGRLRVPGRQGANELAFDNQKKRRKNYANAGPGTGSGSLITAEPPGEAASHRTRCAWNSGCSSFRYLESESGCLRCKRGGCFVCISCVVEALPGQCLRRTPGTNPLFAAVFRTERLRGERCSATCQRRRRPGQARRRQGRLQIMFDRHVTGPFGGAWLEVSRSGNLALVCRLWQVAALSVSRRCPTLVRTAVGAQHWWIMAPG